MNLHLRDQSWMRWCSATSEHRRTKVGSTRDLISLTAIVNPTKQMSRKTHRTNHWTRTTRSVPTTSGKCSTDLPTIPICWTDCRMTPASWMRMTWTGSCQTSPTVCSPRTAALNRLTKAGKMAVTSRYYANRTSATGNCRMETIGCQTRSSATMGFQNRSTATTNDPKSLMNFATNCCDKNCWTNWTTNASTSPRWRAGYRSTGNSANCQSSCLATNSPSNSTRCCPRTCSTNSATNATIR